jgi:hypothetical protein
VGSSSSGSSLGRRHSGNGNSTESSSDECSVQRSSLFEAQRGKDNQEVHCRQQQHCQDMDAVATPCLQISNTFRACTGASLGHVDLVWQSGASTSVCCSDYSLLCMHASPSGTSECAAALPFASVLKINK